MDKDLRSIPSLLKKLEHNISSELHWNSPLLCNGFLTQNQDKPTSRHANVIVLSSPDWVYLVRTYFLSSMTSI